jgi:ABC-type amino acid transport system permease subunit
MVRALLCATLAFWSLTREKKNDFFFSFFFVAFFCCCRSQARGPKHHLKRLNAPSHWMLSKLGGIYVSTARSRLPFFFLMFFFFFFFLLGVAPEPRPAQAA